MAFTPTATFGQFFPCPTSFEAKLFTSPETVVVWLTRQQKARTQMITKATGLCAKSRRAVDGGVSRKWTLILSDQLSNQIHRKFSEADKSVYRLVLVLARHFVTARGCTVTEQHTRANERRNSTTEQRNNTTELHNGSRG